MLLIFAQWSNFLINKMGEKMGLRLKKKSLKAIIRTVQEYLADGQTVEEFLYDFRLSEKKWNKFVLKHKKLRNAISDGLVFYRSYARRQLKKDMNRKKGGANTVLAKMAYEDALGWTEAAIKRNQQAAPKKMYKVILDLGPEEGNEDRIIPEEKKEGES